MDANAKLMHRLYALSVCENVPAYMAEEAREDLAALLVIHNMTTEELLSAHNNPEDYFLFGFDSQYECGLLIQIVGKVIRSSDVRYVRRSAGRVEIALRHSQAAKVDLMYFMLRLELKKALEQALLTVIGTHRLFSPGGPVEHDVISPDQRMQSEMAIEALRTQNTQGK